MPRLTKNQWADVRAEREAGASFGELQKKYNVNAAAICRKAKKEDWGDGSDVAQDVRRKVNEKVNDVNTGDPEKRAAAIDEAAEKSAAVVRRHRDETNAIRDRLYAGLRLHKEANDYAKKRLAFEDLKAAKISSECLLNIHKAERQAWGIDDRQTDTLPPVHFYLPANGR